MSGGEADGALRLTLDVWHPGCWVLDVTERIEGGLLGYGVYSRGDGRATTHYTAYTDQRATIERALASIREYPSVYSVSTMAERYRRPDGPIPGNATQDAPVEHDGTTQISEAFTSRGFAYAAPADAYGDRERWTVLSNDDREAIRSGLDEIRADEDAEITVASDRAREPIDR